MMRLHNLFIINKAGGLIYTRSFSSSSRLEGNDFLSMASTFHSLHAIASQISPNKEPYIGGIESLQADTFTLSCFQTMTGLKFFVTADVGATDLMGFLHGVYELYADYVLKNPFYTLDQAIRCSLFDTHLVALAEKYLANGQNTKVAN